jgi:hypothetical protein
MKINEIIIEAANPAQQAAIAISKKKEQGVAEGFEQINEYRDRLLQYVKSLLPTWPEYVLKDWLVPNKGDFSNLPADALKNSVMEKLQLVGLSPNTKWQLVPNMKFTLDMFNPMSKERLIGRAGGHSDMGLDVPKDKERHATQAALAQQQGGVRKEPVLLIKTAKGYELLEGWHRTIQHFVKYPEGYTGPAYVAVAQGQQGVAEDWNKVNKSDKTSGMSQKAVNAYRRENPGSKLKTAVTTKPSKLKAGSKDAKRRKSFCARMSGNKGPMKKPNGKPTPKALALRRWNCESVEQMEQLVMIAEQKIRNLKK